MQIQLDVGTGQRLRPVRAINRPVGSLDNVGNGAVDLYNVGDKFYHNSGIQTSGIWM
jgi:hypothetical protein